MTFWTRKPSLVEQMVEMMKEDRRVQAEMQARQFDVLTARMQSVTEQTGVIRDYLKLFTETSKPEVRTMTNADEVGVEQKMKDRRRLDDQQIMEKMPVDMADWMGQMGQVFNDLKGEY
jgi:hypothetical protein